MHLKEAFGIGLEPQFMRWELVDDVTGRVKASGEQHNLVLSQAANTLFAQYGLQAMTNFACVGSGSTAPAVGQTGLVAELARTGAVPSGETDSVTRVTPGVYDVRRVRQFTAAQVGNQNLTEWGFSPIAAVASNLAHRELFRDGGNNPITISPTATQNLRLIKVDRITLGPAAAINANINIAGFGVRSGRLFIIRGESGPPFYQDNADLNTIEGLISGNANISCSPLFGVVAENYANFIEQTSFSTGVAAYAANSKTRSTSSALFDQNAANAIIYGFTLGYTGIYKRSAGVVFQLNSGQEFTKTNLNQLTINPWSVSWT